MFVANGIYSLISGRRAKGEGRRAKGEGRRAKGEGRRAKGEGRRAKGEGRHGSAARRGVRRRTGPSAPAPAG
ncbi:hypothetical protein CGL57_13545 [Edwardsiella anguillarum]|nr:hypothetical protein CGL57_13545 [Edwardsiella anguillarum]